MQNSTALTHSADRRGLVKYFGETPWVDGVILGTDKHGAFWRTTFEDRVHFCKDRKLRKKAACPFFIFLNVPAGIVCWDAVNDYKHFHCHKVLKEYKRLKKQGKVHY